MVIASLSVSLLNYGLICDYYRWKVADEEVTPSKLEGPDAK